MEMCRAVIQDALEHTAGTPTEGLAPGGDDFAAHGRGFTKLQFTDGEKFSAIFVAARFVEQQIFDRENLQSGEEAGAFFADTPDFGHGRGEGSNIGIRRHGRTIRTGTDGFNAKAAISKIEIAKQRSTDAGVGGRVGLAGGKIFDQIFH